MTRVLLLCALMIPMSFQAKAGYVPPPESPYWCYQACIDPYSDKHYECVEKCYGSKKTRFSLEKLADSSCEDRSSNAEATETMAAACCSWGEGITGCMPGC